MPSIPQPVRCRPIAYKYFAAQVNVIETPDALLNAASAIAMHEQLGAHPADVYATICGFADTVRQRVRSDNPQAILAHVHALLFEEEGFIGNTEDYYNPQNSYLHAVLRLRTGIPITLCLIYKSVLDHLGIRCFGVNAPGHFLIAVDLDTEGDYMIVDPFFGGKIMSTDEMIRRAQEILGRPIPDATDMLTPASHRQWLQRLLTNLYNIFAQTRRYNDMAAMQEMRWLVS